MTDTMMIHTDAPLMPLTRMVGGTAKIDVGKTLRGEPDCIAGWFEPQDSPLCRPHHILSDIDAEEALWIASTLAKLGHQVVITDVNEIGDDVVLDDAPMLYLDDHHH